MRAVASLVALLVLAGCARTPPKPAEASLPPGEAADRKAALVRASAGLPLGTPMSQVPLEPGDVLPFPVRQPEPVYPADLASRKVKGKAAVEFYVETDGTVATAYVVSATDPLFGQAAIDCVKQWKFTPGTRRGVAVRVRLVVPMEFAP